MRTDSCESRGVFDGANRETARRHSRPGRRGRFSPSSSPIMKMPIQPHSVLRLCAAALSGCGGGPAQTPRRRREPPSPAPTCTGICKKPFPRFSASRRRLPRREWSASSPSPGRSFSSRRTRSPVRTRRPGGWTTTPPWIPTCICGPGRAAATSCTYGAGPGFAEAIPSPKRRRTGALRAPG